MRKLVCTGVDFIALCLSSYKRKQSFTLRALRLAVHKGLHLECESLNLKNFSAIKTCNFRHNLQLFICKRNFNENLIKTVRKFLSELQKQLVPIELYLTLRYLLLFGKHPKVSYEFMLEKRLHKLHMTWSEIEQWKGFTICSSQLDSKF